MPVVKKSSWLTGWLSAMLRTRNWLEALIVCRSRLAQATHVLEQGFITAHACAGAALVPIAVPERRALVLHDAGTPSSDWRHNLATGCHSVATAHACGPVTRALVHHLEVRLAGVQDTNVPGMLNTGNGMCPAHAKHQNGYWVHCHMWASLALVD